VQRGSVCHLIDYPSDGFGSRLWDFDYECVSFVYEHSIYIIYIYNIYNTISLSFRERVYI